MLRMIVWCWQLIMLHVRDHLYLGTCFSGALHGHLSIDGGSDKLVRNVHHRLDCNKEREWGEVGKYRTINLHSTISVILLLTEGGILLLAMQRYAPICSREISWEKILNTLPLQYSSKDQPEGQDILPGTCCCSSWLRCSSEHLCRWVCHPRVSM